MKVRPIFAWFDLWVGVFIDRPRRRVYVFPVPCLGIVISFPTPATDAGATTSTPPHQPGATRP